MTLGREVAFWRYIKFMSETVRLGLEYLKQRYGRRGIRVFAPREEKMERWRPRAAVSGGTDNDTMSHHATNVNS